MQRPVRQTILWADPPRVHPPRPSTLIDPELLAILACPASRQPLAHADEDLIARVNARIEAGGVKNVGGVDVTDALAAALVREDGALLYPVRDDIPVLLREEGIEIGDA